MTESVTLRNKAGAEATLYVSNLGDKTTWGPQQIPTIERDEAGTLQLLEEIEYEFTTDIGRLREVHPSEIFGLSNSKTGGRLRPKGRTGLVRIDAVDEDGVSYTGELEVRSRKLDYLTEYRWMLDRIAAEASELALSPFAASHLSGLSADHSQTPETLYQRFEFLRSRVESDEFKSAMGQLRHRPHTTFEEQREIVPIYKPIRGGRSLARQLTKPGPREPVHRSVRNLDTLPRKIERITHEETLDTVPNRFVRYVTEDWLALIDEIEKALLGSRASKKLPSIERARHEITSVRGVLEEVMRMPAVRDSGRLTQFPSSNTVVRSRAGYREFLSAFQDTNALAHLQWDEAQDEISAGQHDVPTLYEYWVFLEVARLVGKLGFDLEKEQLLSVTNGGLRLELRKANEVVVKASGEHNNTRVELELWFNKSFSFQEGSSVSADRSWSVEMRPDVSLSIKPIGLEHVEKTWVHFDAKYKVKQYTKDFVDAERQNDSSVDKHALPADIQKMHAYRDAIRRSAGAYVLYPGDKRLGREQYHELLPGLGAFALRPTDGGQADEKSSSALKRFIVDVIEHLTSQGTAYQRDRYWRSEVHQEAGYLSPQRQFLERPPADTPVLLGYLRGAEHSAAVKQLGVYNLRADPDREGAVDLASGELGAKFIVVYGQGTALVYKTTGDVLVRRSDDLSVSGYEPQGELYLCLPFEPEPLMELDEDRIASLARQHSQTGAEPAAVTWAEIEPDQRKTTGD